MMSVLFRYATWIVIGLTATACTHVRVASSSRQGLVLLELPPTAQVYVNKQYWGTGVEVEGLPRELPVGRHEIFIVEPQCQPYYGILYLKANELVRRRPSMICTSKGNGV